MGGGGGVEIFYLRIKELFFFPCPGLTPIVSDIQYDLNEEKCKKWRKTCGESALSRRASPAIELASADVTAERDAWKRIATGKTGSKQR